MNFSPHPQVSIVQCGTNPNQTDQNESKEIAESNSANRRDGYETALTSTKRSLRDSAISSSQKRTQTQANSVTFGGACDFFFRNHRGSDAETRRVKAVFDSPASNRGTAKRSRLPISPIRFEKKKKKTPSQNRTFLAAAIAKKKSFLKTLRSPVRVY